MERAVTHVIRVFLCHTQVLLCVCVVLKQSYLKILIGGCIFSWKHWGAVKKSCVDIWTAFVLTWLFLLFVTASFSFNWCSQKTFSPLHCVIFLASRQSLRVIFISICELTNGTEILAFPLVVIIIDVCLFILLAPCLLRFFKITMKSAEPVNLPYVPAVL